MKKRLILIALILTFLVCCACFVWILLPDGPGISKTNFDRIENGMTRAQVEEIFDGPPTGNLPAVKAGHTTVVWSIRGGFVGAVVVFDEQGQVVLAEWRDHTFVGRLRNLFP